MEEQLVVLVDPWRDKYDRLLEAHEKLQNLNQNLEEKLLKLAERNHGERERLSFQIQELTQRLVEARLYIHQLEDENDRYRNDINVVVQLLHCKPSNFVGPKLETLPEDLQRKVLGQRNGSNCKKEKKIIKVQVPTFPPTDIMYSVDKGKGKKNSRDQEKSDLVSAAIMAKILQEREAERRENRKNRCKCASRIVLPTIDSNTQTLPVCTISYSDFNYEEFLPSNNHSTTLAIASEDDEDEEDEVGEEHDDEDEDSSSAPDEDKKTGCSTTSTNKNKITSLITPTSIDDIMKTDQREEELLPTPLFLRRRDVLKTNAFKSSEDSGFLSSSNSTKHDNDDNRLDDDEESDDHFKIMRSPTTTTSNSNVNAPMSTSTHGIGNGRSYNHGSGNSGSGRSFPSPTSQSLSSVSPVSSTDLVAAASACSSSSNNDVMPSESQLLFEGNPSNSSQFGYESSSSSGGGSFSRKLPGRPVSIGNWGDPNCEYSNSTRAGLVSHWRSTVLVHHPPKSHSYEPLSLTSNVMMNIGPSSSSTNTHHHQGGSHQQTTFSATGSRELLLDSPTRTTCGDGDDEDIEGLGAIGGIGVGFPTNATSKENAPLLQGASGSQHQHHQYNNAQYYRAQKRTFWTRSSSTTSTETEI